MIGKTIESVPHFPWGGIFWTAVGGAMLAAGLAVANENVAIAAAAPLCLGLGLWWGQPRPLDIKVTESGLDLGGRAGLVPYAHLEMVALEGDDPAARKGRMFVYHSRGVYELPANLSVDRGELHAFLIDSRDRHREPKIHMSLVTHLADQQEKFGADHVWYYRGRSIIRAPRSLRLLRAVLAGLALAGVIWTVAGMAVDAKPWVGGGLMTAVVCGLLLLATLARPSPPLKIKNWRAASLIISPLGIALSQGDVQGQLRWSELRDMKLVKGLGRTAVVRLDVSGAYIVIADVYDAPLSTIFEQMRGYWKQP